MRLRKHLLVTIPIAVLSVFLVWDPSSLFRAPNLPRAAKNNLKNSEALPIIGTVGPESLAFDPDGRGPYTGTSDGRILRWQGKEQVWDEFAFTSPKLRESCNGTRIAKNGWEMEHVCGRPLGLRFDQRSGELYIADAYLGLFVVGRDGGQARPVVTQAQGVSFGFTNALDIDLETGDIYFTDSSTQFRRREFTLAIISGDKTGRLMKYNKKSKETTVLLQGLSFPNGVALSKDGSFILIAVTTTCRVLRLWLQTSKAGTLEVLAHLPGFPDNIKMSPRGGFWVALHSRRGRLKQWYLSQAWLGKTSLWLLRKLKLERVLFTALARSRGNDAMAVRLNEEGVVLEVLEDKEASVMKSVSEVLERNGSLWIGSVDMPFVSVCRL